MKKLVLSFLTICTVLFAYAQKANKPLDNSLLWKVTGKGLQQPSYLFGTLHGLCEKDFHFTDKIKKALTASQKLVLEINKTDSAELAMAQQDIFGTTPITAGLSDAEVKELDSLLKLQGLPMEQVKSLKPFVILSVLAFKEISKCTGMKMWEDELISFDKNKPVGALETMQLQMKIVDSVYTNKDLIPQLKTAAITNLSLMAAIYTSENITRLDSLMTNPQAMTKAQFTSMLKNRNLNWVSKMPQMMQKESVFFGVGAGHLAGEFGVINLLKQQGYIVEAVK